MRHHALLYFTLLHQAAGFSLPTVDTDKVVVHYPDAWTLFHHLRAMGDSHAVLDRSARVRAKARAGLGVGVHLSVGGGGGEQRLLTAGGAVEHRV